MIVSTYFSEYFMVRIKTPHDSNNATIVRAIFACSLNIYTVYIYFRSILLYKLYLSNLFLLNNAFASDKVRWYISTILPEFVPLVVFTC